MTGNKIFSTRAHKIRVSIVSLREEHMLSSTSP
jgi:hypothetical protein